MKTVKGIYAGAKIFTDGAEDYALAQVKMIFRKESHYMAEEFSYEGLHFETFSLPEKSI